MAAAVLHRHRHTTVITAVGLPEARLIAKDVDVWVPAEGLSAMSAPPGVAVVPEPQRNPEAAFYAEL